MQCAGWPSLDEATCRAPHHPHRSLPIQNLTCAVSLGSSKSESEVPAKKKKCSGRAASLGPKNGTMLFYTAKVQRYLDSSKDQFWINLCSLDTLPESLESFDHTRDTIRLEATHLDIDGLFQHYCLWLWLTMSADIVIDNLMMQLVCSVIFSRTVKVLIGTGWW